MSGASSNTRTSTAISRAPSRRLQSARPARSPTERCDMTNGLSSPRAAQGPPGPAPEAARGAPPPSDAFAGILGDAQQARTATAEGQSPEKPTAARDDCTTPAQTAPGDTPTDAPTPDAAATAAAVLAALPVPVQVTPTPSAPEAEATPVAPASTAMPVAAVPAPVVAPEAAEQIAAVPVAPEAPAAAT